ncbi:hypothetical protein AMELA_G00217820 [Ameiurus melas]|uniref:Uncharacterized protein n=1 Tax=Ameiurus melas TaxID=219545 RepID=A0A7J6A1C0_AMEME|nr:hypothetical protein AMELA_G00217820 [Ameiurus melas]
MSFRIIIYSPYVTNDMSTHQNRLGCVLNFCLSDALLLASVLETSSMSSTKPVCALI